MQIPSLSVVVEVRDRYLRSGACQEMGGNKNARKQSLQMKTDYAPSSDGSDNNLPSSTESLLHPGRRH